MIRKYHEIAKANGAIVSGTLSLLYTHFEADIYTQIIPEIGLESAPADLVSWSLASLIREQLSVGTRETIMSIHEMEYVLTQRLQDRL